MNFSKTNETLKNIHTSLNKTKTFFHERLTDGTNEYLDRADYSSSPIDFYWQNDKGVPVYIMSYKFIYAEGSEPTPDELYHSTSWDSKIGAMNSNGDDYEVPYITVKDNKDYYTSDATNSVKQQWTTPQGALYFTDFSFAPVEIGVSRKFGHHIQANINTNDYESDPVGIVEGYYYTD